MIIRSWKLLILNLIVLVAWLPFAILYLGFWLGSFKNFDAGSIDAIKMLTILFPVFPLFIILGLVNSIKLLVALKKNIYNLNVKNGFNLLVFLVLGVIFIGIFI